MSILDDVKSVASTVQEINNLDLYKRVLDLNKGIIDLVEENRGLRAENEALQAKLTIQGKMTFNKPFYYQEGDETPYCPGCWEGDRRAIHVVLITDNESLTSWDCPTCKNHYRINKPARGGGYPSARPGPWI